MKNSLLLFLMLSIQATSFGQTELEYLLNQEELICKESARAEEMVQFGHSRNEFAHQTDMHYQVMSWEIDPAVYYINGEITYYFKSLIPGLTELILDFTTDLEINSITRNGISLNYTHGSDQLLRIGLGKSLGIGQHDTLTINYEGMPPSNGFGSFEQAFHEQAPIIWTLSEPYGVRDWWPGKQDLIDKIDSVDIYITTPQGNLAASNGKLMSITESNGKLVHHWRHRYPIVAYLVALAVTNYASYSQYIPTPDGDSIEMLNYVYPENLDAAKQNTLRSIEIMQFYNEVFGLYPFASEKYGHAQFSWGGGEEHQTMSFMGNFTFDLQAHEMAHQWFGDKVTCGSWTDIWLNEGFATYLTGLAYERISPNLYWPIWKSSTSNAATLQPGGSVWVDDTTSVNRIFNGRLSYNKASYLLHMMRWISGDTAFFQACRNYLDLPGTAYEFGRTPELKGFMENASGKDFDEFLNDWFYGQGYPSYDLRWTQVQDSLIVWVGQRQSHPSVAFFEMPIPILVVLDDIENIFRVEHTSHDQRFSFYIGEASVDSIGFDPERWVLSRNNTITEITTATKDHLANDGYIIFPNPVSSYFEVIPSTGIHKVEIIDAVGRVHFHSLTGNKVEVSDYSPGIYTILLKDQDGIIIAVRRLLFE